MNYFIKASKFFYAEQSKKEGYLEIKEGHFGDYFETLPTGKAEILDYTGKWIAPGLVDTHIHGFMGVDVMDNDWKSVTSTLSEGLLSCGVTSFLPSTLTGPSDLLEEICQALKEHYQEAKGAKIQGIFFEGPYFTEKHKGAQNTAYMHAPSLTEFHKWQAAAGGLIKKLALAPEWEEATDFISAATDEGLVIALGHSDASYKEAQEAVNAGATMWVHTYNGMSGLSHYEPGMVGAAMTLKHTYPELICDGHHVHPAACRILMDKVGRDHVVLITDCMRAGGMPEGEYNLGEFVATVKDGAARIGTGSLAGSVLQLKDAVKNVVDWGIATPEEAITMASLNPAISSKIDDRCGKIRKGREADFIVLDEQMNVRATFVNGEKKFEVSL